jgi:heme/copper-type cytochrome/quinol oxidase subunit 3
MEIPYTVHARPDTGLPNAKLGIWLFLASEVMLFGALFSSYVLLRVSAPEWPHGYEELSVPLATFNTIVLISSSVTMVMAWAQLKLQNLGRARMYLWTTVALACVFMIVKAFEYTEHVTHGELPSESTFLAIYFTLAGLHGLHVLGGIIVNSYLAGPGAAMWTTEPERFTNRVEVSGLYWHFVDLVWIFLFPALYLL